MECNGNFLMNRCHSGIGDAKALGPCSERFKQFILGAGHPRLAAKRRDLVEQRLAPQSVEVGRDFIEQQVQRGERREATLASKREMIERQVQMVAPSAPTACPRC